MVLFCVSFLQNISIVKLYRSPLPTLLTGQTADAHFAGHPAEVHSGAKVCPRHGDEQLVVALLFQQTSS